jgi:hypothetical protein
MGGNDEKAVAVPAVYLKKMVVWLSREGLSGER